MGTNRKSVWPGSTDQGSHSTSSWLCTCLQPAAFPQQAHFLFPEGLRFSSSFRLGSLPYDCDLPPAVKFLACSVSFLRLHMILPRIGSSLWHTIWEFSLNLFIERVHSESSTELSMLCLHKLFHRTVAFGIQCRLHSHSRADALFSPVSSERLPTEINGVGYSSVITSLL